jgi:hypothetical protein
MNARDAIQQQDDIEIEEMTVDPKTMVADLRRRARKLLDAATAIEEAYGLSPSMGDELPREDAALEEQEGAVTVAPAARGERRMQLIQFLKDGPKHRGDIKKYSGIPVGSISYLLKDDSTFERLEDGRWRAKGNAIMRLEHQ